MTPNAVVLYPIAVEENQLACVTTPIATEYCQRAVTQYHLEINPAVTISQPI